MNAHTELDRRLIEWADEYKGGKYDNIGWPDKSALAVIIKYHGRPPQGLNPRAIIGTAADEIERIVQELQGSAEGYRPARVIRCEYWMPNAAMQSRLQYLFTQGAPCSRASYFQHLKVARFFLVGRLGLPLISARLPEHGLI